MPLIWNACLNVTTSRRERMVMVSGLEQSRGTALRRRTTEPCALSAQLATSFPRYDVAARTAPCVQQVALETTPRLFNPRYSWNVSVRSPITVVFHGIYR